MMECCFLKKAMEFTSLRFKTVHSIEISTLPPLCQGGDPAEQKVGIFILLFDLCLSGSIGTPN